MLTHNRSLCAPFSHSFHHPSPQTPPILLPLAIDPDQPTVYEKYGVAKGVVPRGVQKFVVEVNKNNLTFWGTGPWLDGGGSPLNAFDRVIVSKKSCGAVTVDLNANVSLPLSVVGLTVTLSLFGLQLKVPAEGSCTDSPLTASEIQQLATDSALPQTFLKNMQYALPDWVQLKVDQTKTADSSGASDTAVGIFNGEAAKKVTNCNVSWTAFDFFLSHLLRFPM